MFFFNEIWHNIQKTKIEFACFSFHVGLLFHQLFSFKSETENNANFDTLHQANVPTLMPFCKEDRDWLQDVVMIFGVVCMHVKVTRLESL